MGGGDGFEMRTVALVVALLVLTAMPAVAHTTSTALAVIDVADATVTYRLTLVVPELAVPELFAAAGRGDAAAATRVVELLGTRITVRADGGPCRPGRGSVQGSALGDQRLTVTLTYRCGHSPVRLTVRDDSFGVFGEHHQTIARVETSEGIREAAFSPGAREVVLEIGTAARPTSGFVVLGVTHIVTGWDHLLFLAALLLGGGGVLALLKVITSFTVAHSLSLAGAVLGIVHIPERLVESVIAASIAWVAIENVIHREGPRRRWLTSFVFGLVHGLGFASALTPLALPPRSLAEALVGFNVGVKMGQAAAIVVALPVFVWLRSRPWETRALRASSLVVAAIGTAWCVRRAFFE